MQESDYLKSIYAKADEISAGLGMECRTVECIYMAMLDAYAAEYETNEPPVRYGNSLDYERERMSYIIAQTHSKHTARLFGSYLKNKKNSMQGPEAVPSVISAASDIARAKKQEVLSADLLLVALLPQLSQPFNRFLKDSFDDLLHKAYNESGENAKEFMKSKIALRVQRLEEEARKARELEAYLNRKPVEKVGEEADIRKQIVDAMRIEDQKTHSVITLPFWFHGAAEPLSLFATRKDGQVYFSDRGRTYSELRERGPADQLSKMVQYFARVDLEINLNSDHEIVAPIRDVKMFFDYLQVISRAANADMYPSVDEYYFDRYNKYATVYSFPSDGTAPLEFTRELINSVKVGYDSNLGIYVSLPFYFNDESCPMGLCLKVAEANKVSVTDFGDFDGGRLFQRMDWLNDDIHIYDAKITEICNRFGCLYEENKISCVFDNADALSLPKALFTFIQLASILSEIGHFVVL